MITPGIDKYYLNKYIKQNYITNEIINITTFEKQETIVEWKIAEKNVALESYND